MNLKKLVAFLVLSVFFVSTGFVFAENLEIEEGKNLKFDFKGENTWYDDTELYDNVNIGAGTRVVLNSQWEYIYKGCHIENSEVNTEIEDPQDITATTVYEYAKEENLATLSIKSDGKLILNSGSELSLRNQYNLVTSVNNVSLQYQENEQKEGYIDLVEENLNRYLSSYNSGKKIYKNREATGTAAYSVFKGDIVFENGDDDTKLIFEGVSTKTSEVHVLPEVNPSSQTYEGQGYKGGNLITKDAIEEIKTATLDNKNNIVKMENDFIINSNRSVISVNFDGKREDGEWSENNGQVLLGKKGEFSYLSGDGTIVKQGIGALSLAYNTKDRNTGDMYYVDGQQLTGANTGYAWRIEQGSLVVHKQENLGNAGVYIDSGGNLTLSRYSYDTMFSSTVVLDVQSGAGLSTNAFSNNITSAGGGISVISGSMVELDGNLNTAENNSSLSFGFYENSVLVLSGENDAKNFYINFGGKQGGASNYLVTDVDGLASESINVTNTTGEEEREFAFFEILLKEDEDKEYAGSLNGEMYLHKLGSGIVTISGNNTYDRGTYITEGGLLLATSNSIGTGNILFDGGVRGDSTTYASIGVSSNTTTGDVIVTNNIHVKNGAILDVADNQNLYLQGDLVRYDARPGYEAEFIKNGLGNAIISQIEGVDRKINISTFTVTEGGFILDKSVASDSYFSINGQQAFLEVRENAEVKNNAIDINNGDLIIFNDKCISSATAVNFNNEATSPEDFSKFHILSDAVLSDETIAVSSITVKKNIEFVAGSTDTAEADDTATAAVVTAQMDKFKFEAGENTTIVKSGDGKFVAEGNGDFALDSLYVNGGTFRIEDTDMTVSNTTLIDGGILSISSTSHFASTADEKKIVVLDGGGIGIYDDNSIDSDTKLSFEGTDEQNLSRLVVEAADVELTNDIYVKTGVIIENENTLTFSGDSIDYDPSTAGILAKDGAGDMIIDSAGTFRMGELDSLGGNLLIKSNIDVNSISIEGENALLSFENVNNAKINDSLSLASGGTLSVSTSTLNLGSSSNPSDLRMISGTIINNNSNINADVIDCSDSLIDLVKNTSVINAQTINLKNSVVQGFGNLNSSVNVRSGSKVYIGSDGTTGESLTVKNINFESGSDLYIDIDDETGASDKLKVSGDITVQKNVTLYVNFIGIEDDGDGAADINSANAGSSDKTREFEFLTFTGSYNFANPTNEIFNIILNDPTLSANTSLKGNSIFLQIVQAWGGLYDIPGVTKNQQEMIDLFNGLTGDNVESMKPLLDTIKGYYTTYLNTGDKTVFINALQDLSGIFYANSFMTSAMLSKANILYNRLNENFDEREEDNRVWAQVYTNNFTVSENDENPEFENSIYGIIAGYDTVQDESLTFGIAGFYGQGELKQLDDKADIIDAGVNVYGDYKVNENIDVKGLIGYSMQDYDTTRKLRFNKQEITSKYATNTINLDLEAAYKFNLGDKFLLKPLVGANCAIVSNGDIEEDGDTIQKLKIKKGTHSRAEARVGVGLQGVSDSPFNWHVSAAIKHIVSGSKFTTKSSFVEAPGYEFEIESTEVAGTSFSGLFGCSYDINSNINISLDLNADAGAVSQFGGNIGASYKW